MRTGPSLRTARLLLPAAGIALVLFGSGCRSSPPSADRFPGYPIGYVERGVASWYGPGFHGNKTANGERYDMHKLTAAHRTLPLGSVATVRSLTSGRKVTVRINDRGPFARGRILDLSLAAAEALAMTGNGTDRIEIQVVGYTGPHEGMGVLRIQVGSFAELQNAQMLFQQVRSDYPGGRIAQIDLPEGRRYRVQVGRFSTEGDAQTGSARLDRKYNLQSFVIRDDG
jgi:rare lipoprotein A